MKTTSMHPAQLEIGDVLLCRGDTKRWGFPAYLRSEISIASSSVYTHAAIYIGNGRILDAQVRQGVTVRSVVELLAEATYVAVLRQPFWRNEAAHAALAAFTPEMSTRRVKYNRRRFFDFLLKPSRDKQLTWERQAAENQASTFQQLEEFFESGAHPLDGRAEEYFCSELVVHAFERCGVVSRAVLIPNNPTFIAPGDLAKDATYGYLVGFMAKGPEFEVPDDDALRFQPTLQEIFGS